MKNKYYPHLFEKGKIGNVVIKNAKFKKNVANRSLNLA